MSSNQRSRSFATLRHVAAMAARIALATGLLSAATAAVWRGVAEWHFQRDTLAGYEQAVRWNPRNPKYHFALARAHELTLADDSPDVLRLLEEAVQQGPHRAEHWARLGTARELAGDMAGAEAAYRRAQELFPHSPEINWRLGNFQIRAGRSVEAFPSFRAVLNGGPQLQRAVFQIARRSTDNNERILRELLSAEPGHVAAYLSYLVDVNELDAAAQCWSHLLEMGQDFRPRVASSYLDALLHAGRYEELLRVWEQLSERFPLSIPRAEPENAVRNPGFEMPVLNWGLDWRASPALGVRGHIDNQVFYEGTHSLRLDFDGTRNLHFDQVMQFVPVRPGTVYRFSGYLRARNVTTDKGLCFELRDAQDATRLRLLTEGATGSAGWAPYSLVLRTGPETRMLRLSLTRLPSRKFASHIAGTVWVDNLRLTPSQESSGQKK